MSIPKKYLSTLELKHRIAFGEKIKKQLFDNDKPPVLPKHLRDEEEFYILELACRQTIIKL